ncbi:MAG: hypothetical protein ACK5ME_13220 [Parahaliea sp.]
MEYLLSLQRLPDRQRGVALAVVMWFLAAMSLLVAGIVAHSRVDTQLAQIHVARAKVAAAGDGAIQLMMDRFLSAGVKRADRDSALPNSGRFQLGDMAVQVSIRPASLLIDVFSAPPRLLAALFVHRGGLSDARAQALAETMVKLRSSRRSTAQQSTSVVLATQEDLLQLPGFSRVLLDAITDDIVPVPGSSVGRVGGVSPAAVIDALQVGGELQLGTDDGADAEGGTGSRNLQDSTLLRVDAVIEYNGQRWLRRRWLKISPGSDSGLPWHSIRIEAPRVVASTGRRSNP